MKLIRILLLTLLTIDVFAQSDQRGQNIEELKQLYFGIDNIININGLGIDNPFATPEEIADGGEGRNRTGVSVFFKTHYSATTTPPPEANSLITNERQ